MAAGYGKDLVKLFRKNGCRFVRNGKGDHQVWYSPLTNRNITLDYGTNNKYTANGTLREAGINQKL